MGDGKPDRVQQVGVSQVCKGVWCVNALELKAMYIYAEACTRVSNLVLWVALGYTLGYPLGILSVTC